METIELTYANPLTGNLETITLLTDIRFKRPLAALPYLFEQTIAAAVQRVETNGRRFN